MVRLRLFVKHFNHYDLYIYFLYLYLFLFYLFIYYESHAFGTTMFQLVSSDAVHFDLFAHLF